MRGVLLATLAFVALTTATSNVSLEIQWQEFKQKFEKSYTSLEEENTRKTIFMENLEKVNIHNAKYAKGLTTYTKGINQFSDWTFEEFQSTILMKEVKTKAPFGVSKRNSTRAPSSVDWRDLMGPVRNQRHCGSCWAFAAVGATEGAWAKAGRGKLDLSEQRLIDCGQGGSCDGGSVSRALRTLTEGDCSEEDYPYTSEDGEDGDSCKYDPATEIAIIKDYNKFHVDDEGIDYLAFSIAENGPHATHLYANENFHHYKSGIFDDHSCPTDKHNHALVIVGYDMEEGYWLIRNSWGGDWGDHGHIKMAMGKNVCNVERDAWLAIL